MIDPNGTIWQVQLYSMGAAPPLYLNFATEARAKEAVLAFDTVAMTATADKPAPWHWVDDNDRLLVAILPYYCAASCCNFEADHLFAREFTERAKKLQQHERVGFGA